MKHREFTRWVEANETDFKLVQVIPNPYPFKESDNDWGNTSVTDFYVFARTS